MIKTLRAIDFLFLDRAEEACKRTHHGRLTPMECRCHVHNPR